MVSDWATKNHYYLPNPMNKKQTLSASFFLTEPKRLILVLFCLLLWTPLKSSGAERSYPRLKTQLAKTTTIQWENVPLHEALVRLGDTMQLHWFLDRRIDPTQRIQLKMQSDTLAVGLDQMAKRQSLTLLCYGETLYIGPSKAAAALSEIQENRIFPASASIRRRLKRRNNTYWSRLAEPKKIVTELAKEIGFQIQTIEAIPHDLWNQGSLGKQTAAERLDLLLIGFDLTWNIVDSEIRLVPLDVNAASKTTVSLSDQIKSKRSRRASKKGTPKTEQRYTLQIQDQPLNAVLNQIANQTGKQLQIGTTATEKINQRISVSVKQVSLEELIEELCKAVELNSSVEKDIIRVYLKP